MLKGKTCLMFLSYSRRLLLIHTAPYVAVGCSEVKEALNMEGKGLSLALLPLRGTFTIRNAPNSPT